MNEWLMPIHKENSNKKYFSLLLITILTITMIGFLYLHFNSTPPLQEENQLQTKTEPSQNKIEATMTWNDPPKSFMVSKTQPTNLSLE